MYLHRYFFNERIALFSRKSEVRSIGMARVSDLGLAHETDFHTDILALTSALELAVALCDIGSST